MGRREPPGLLSSANCAASLAPAHSRAGPGKEGAQWVARAGGVWGGTKQQLMVCLLQENKATGTPTRRGCSPGAGRRQWRAPHHTPCTQAAPDAECCGPLRPMYSWPHRQSWILSAVAQCTQYS